MKGGPYICSVCIERIPHASDRYEERIEYRRSDRSRSLASITLRRLCKKCADEAAKQMRGHDWNQRSLNLGEIT